MKRIILFLLIFTSILCRGQDADSLLQQYRTYPDDTNKINLLYDKGFEIHNTNIPAAIEFAKACYVTAQKVGNPHYLAKALNFTGILRSQTGLQQEALADLKKALQLRVQTRDTFSQAIILNNIGNVYRDLSNTQEAMNCYESALKLAQIVKSDRWTLGSLFSISEMQAELKRYGQAEGNLYTLISWAQIDNDQEILGLCYKNMSDCKLGLGDTIGAEAYLGLAMDAAEMTEDDIQKADVLLATAKVELLQKKQSESDKHMNEAMRIYTRNNYSEGLVKGWKQWSELLNTTGDHKLAYLYLSKYDSAMQVSRSLAADSLANLWRSGTAEEAVVQKENSSLSRKIFECVIIVALLGMLLVVSLKKPHEQKEQKG